MSQHDTLLAAFETYKAENEKFIEKGIKASAARARKALQEIAGACKEVIIILKHGTRAFVPKLDFVTSLGHGTGPGSRKAAGLIGGGPTSVITDLGILKPNPESLELELVQLHPGVTVEQVRENTGWDLKVAAEIAVTPEPNQEELEKVRQLIAERRSLYNQVSELTARIKAQSRQM